MFAPSTPSAHCVATAQPKVYICLRVRMCRVKRLFVCLFVFVICRCVCALDYSAMCEWKDVGSIIIIVVYE